MNGIAYRDLLMGIILILFAIVVVTVQQAKKDATLDPPGDLAVFTSWSDLPRNDVDTWMYGPGFGQPVGYDHKDSPTCTLVKDDLGIDQDPNNYENIFCRVTPDGEYIINVYSYNVHEQDLPLDVYVKVMLGHQILFDEKITLTGLKQEITVIRFKLKDGILVPGSVHHTPISLFDYRK